MFKSVALATIALSSFSVFASDIELVKSLLPKGEKIAQIRNSEENAEANFIVADINKDGIDDVLVISEEKSKIQHYQTNKPCAEVSDDCLEIFGERYLKFFAGTKSGSFVLKFSNKDVVRTADEGGVFGDPLTGLELKENGSITLSHYGGSAWRWSYKETFSFRKGDLYVIGQDSSSGWTGDMREDTKSVNLLTGQVVETSQKDGDAPVKTKKYKIAVKPLVRVADYKGQEE